MTHSRLNLKHPSFSPSSLAYLSSVSDLCVCPKSHAWVTAKHQLRVEPAHSGLEAGLALAEGFHLQQAMETSSHGKPCPSAPHHDHSMDHSHCMLPERLKGARNHPSRAELATGGRRLPLRSCVVGLELCNLRASSGLMG